MNKKFIVLCATALFMFNAQAVTHPTCKKFFGQMDDAIAHLSSQEREQMQDQWISSKAKIIKLPFETQSRACQNGLSSLRNDANK